MSPVKCTHLYTSNHKLKWCGYGEWIEEPDLIEFFYKGVKCEIKRRLDIKPILFGGYLMGECYLNEKIPDSFIENYFQQISIHGGISYIEEKTIGFDCGHATLDIIPTVHKEALDSYKLNGILPLPFLYQCTYKNMNFAIDQCIKLADQTLEIKNY